MRLVLSAPREDMVKTKKAKPTHTWDEKLRVATQIADRYNLPP